MNEVPQLEQKRAHETGRTRGGSEQAGPAPMWSPFLIGREIIAVEATQRSKGFSPTPATQPRVPELGEEVPTGSENYGL